MKSIHSGPKRKVRCHCGARLCPDGTCSYPWCIPESSKDVLRAQRKARKQNERTADAPELFGVQKEIRTAYERIGAPGRRVVMQTFKRGLKVRSTKE